MGTEGRSRSDDGRMRRRRPLPRALGDAFTTRAAARAGVGRSRRDAADLARPFHGVRSVRAPTTFRERAESYRAIMLPGQTFVGRTALRIWGLPCPWFWQSSEPLHVAVGPAGAAPRGVGVQGRRLALHRWQGWRIAGMPVVDPIAALFTSAGSLTLAEIIVVMDALLTTANCYPGLAGPRPLATRAEVQRRLEEWGRFPGCATVRAALPHARDGVESPKETQTRRLIADAGLPEPVVQWQVAENGRFIARVDLAYPDLRIAIEYEGDGHRTGREQWRTDIRRQRELEDLGWIVIRLTESDLNAPAALLTRLRSALTSRSRRA